MAEGTVDLAFIAEMLKRLLVKVDTIQGDLTVNTAIVMRMDATVQNSITEIRALHDQYAKLARRVRDLEEQRER